MTDDAILYTEVDDVIHLVIEGDGHWLDEQQPPRFVAKTGFLIKQLVAEIVAALAYTFGSMEGRFRGSIVNTDMPLCIADFWEEAASPGIRTWHVDAHGFRFYPYTSSDVRTVTRCGCPTVYLASGQTIMMSPGGDGMSLSGFSEDQRANVLELVKRYDIPVVREDGLVEYVNEFGYLTY